MICIVGNYYELGMQIDFNKYNEIWTFNGGFLKYPSTFNFDMHDWDTSEYLPSYYDKIDERTLNIKKYPESIKTKYSGILTYGMSYALAYAKENRKSDIMIGGITKNYLEFDISFISSFYYFLGLLSDRKVETQIKLFNYNDYGYNLKWNKNCIRDGCVKK